MPRNIDPNLERMIVQHLDGRLSQEQRPTLYRELLRDPEARRTMDDFEANDHLAATALQELFPPRIAEEVPAEIAAGPVAHSVAGPLRWRRHVVRYAAAAAVVALLVTSAWMGGLFNTKAVPPKVTQVPRNPNEPTIKIEPASPMAGNSKIIGLVNEQNNSVYFLEVAGNNENDEVAFWEF